MDRKGLNIGIISGVISSLIVLIFIQPILSLVWKAIMAIGGSVHHGYVDRIYRNAAVIGPDPHGILTLFVLLVVPLLVLLFWSQRVMEFEQYSVYFPRSMKFHKIISWGLAMMAFLIFIARFSILQGTLKIDESFRQRLTILAPAISDAEYKTLKARWAGMQGKADYDALVTAMDRRATELGVTLPPARKP